MKANINGTIQDYKPRPISEDGYTFDVRINGVSITPFDFDVYAAIVESIHDGGEIEPSADVANRIFGFNHTAQEHAAICRSFDRLKKIGLFDYLENDEEHAQDDTSGELETLIDCIDFIERHGDNKADREKAIKAARCLLFDMEQRLGNIDDALSDVIRAIGGGWVFF